jgi:hypothetical protein
VVAAVAPDAQTRAQAAKMAGMEGISTEGGVSAAE